MQISRILASIAYAARAATFPLHTVGRNLVRVAAMWALYVLASIVTLSFGSLFGAVIALACTCWRNTQQISNVATHTGIQLS